jgi:hypothetical protein
MMENDLDILMNSELLSIPNDFTARVMEKVYQAPPQIANQGFREVAQWLALIGSTAIGVFELATYIFGVWTVTTVY